MKAIYLVLCFSTIYSCVHTTKDDNHDDIPVLDDSQLHDSSLRAESQEPFELTLDKVDLKAIKSKYEQSYTSGILRMSENKNFLFQESSQIFIGVYYFTSNSTRIPFVANAIIVCEDYGEWNYSNDNEELVEFCSYSNILNPFHEIVSIGQTKEEVVEKLGKSFNEIENNLIFFDSLGHAATFLFQKDTVQAIRVGIYKSPNEVLPIRLKW